MPDVPDVRNMSEQEVDKLLSDARDYLARIEILHKGYHDNVVHAVCEICDKSDSHYGSLPEGWGWSGGILFCSSCIKRYKDKYGVELETRREI